MTDSTAGIERLVPELRCAVVPLTLEIDGALYKEGADLSAADFYRLLEVAGSPPGTLPPDVDEFAAVYEQLLTRCDSVLSIHLSGELSRTVERAREAATRLGAGDRIAVLDSRLAGAALGLLCLEADARLRRGESLAGILAALERIIAGIRVYFSVYSLDFLYLGGRLDRVGGSGSRVAEDRPILSLEAGKLILVERVIGETTRVDRTVELVAEEFGESEPLTGAVTHAGRRGQAAAGRLEELLGGDPRRVDIAFSLPLGPVLCAHTGFDVCGIAVFPSRLSAAGPFSTP
ncbi:MAG TPA: DegV family protein [Gemmatimonadota bacterium]|nr:DegV family protein [Gemmatimonadota bacterium]